MRKTFSLGIDDAREFFKVLGGKEKNIPSASDEPVVRRPKAFYTVYPSEQEWRFEEVGFLLLHTGRWCPTV